MVESKPRRPDHGVDIQLAVVAERHRRPGGFDRARVEDDATALQGPGAVPDQSVLVLPQALADPRVLRLADQARLVEVPEEVTTEDPLGKRLLGCPDRDVCLPRGGELFGDLVAGVATAYDKHPALTDLARRAIRGAVQLGHLGPQPLGNRRDEGHLVWPRCDNHMVSFDRAII